MKRITVFSSSSVSVSERCNVSVRTGGMRVRRDERCNVSVQEGCSGSQFRAVSEKNVNCAILEKKE